MLKDKLREIIEKGIILKINEGKLGQLKSIEEIAIIIEKPKNPEFGDFSINVSPYARIAKISPVQIAQEIQDALKDEDFELGVIGGFINFKCGKTLLKNLVAEIFTKKEMLHSGVKMWYTISKGIKMPDL